MTLGFRKGHGETVLDDEAFTEKELTGKAEQDRKDKKETMT